MAANPERETLKFKRKPARKRLNIKTVEAIKPPSSGKLWIYDSQTPRLAICVTASGNKSWFWVGRFGSQMVRMKLGGFPELPPDKAKKLAAEKSSDVASGLDPRDDRRRLRTEWTFAELFSDYIEGWGKVHKRSWDEDERNFKRYCGPIKGRRISEITRADIIRLHAKVGKENGKPIANRLVGLLGAVFTYAVDVRRLLTESPVQRIKRFDVPSRERFLSDDELKRLFDALAQEKEIYQDFFCLLLLTGVRRGNLESMRFSQVDFERAEWRIPETKTGAVKLPLATQAMDIIKARRAIVEGDFVFPSGRKGQAHIKEPRVPWERILKKANLENLVMHDLRRTMASKQAALGASLQIIGKSLGQRSLSATQIYARLNMDPVRASVEAAASSMMATKGGDQ